MMKPSPRTFRSAIILAGMLACSTAALAALPKPVLTPAQQEAAAVKKAEADAKAAKDKAALTTTMDTLSTRWRSQAPSKGWRVNPPVAIVAAAPAAVPGTAPGAAPGAPVGVAVNMPGPNTAAAGAAAGAAARVPAGVTPPAAGMPAAAPSTAAPGTAAAVPATGAAPLSRQALNAANVPVKSEKLGTARPSEDVKTRQTQAVPKGVGPAVENKSTPTTANKK